MRAAIYVRLSRETDETTSPERQRAACEALCEARGWEVVAAEEDIDVSGFSRGLDRPGLQRILTRLAELDVIVFFKIDRLARSTVDFAEIMRLAERQSVALASATEPLEPPILDTDIWQELQDEMERRANPGEKRREGTSLLRGIMHCGVCGERMYTFSGRNGQLRYRCIGPLKYRQRAAKGEEKQGVKCYGPTVAGVTAEEHVTEQFLAKYGHLSVMRMVQEVGEDFRPQIRQAEEALADLQKGPL